MEEIINIITFVFATIISLALYIICYAKLNDVKLKLDLKKVVLLTISTLLVVLNNYYTNVNIKFLISSIVITIYFKLFFKDDWKTTIINYVIIFALTISLELLVTNILFVLNILNDNISALKVSYIKIALSIFIYSFEVIICSIPILKRILQKIKSFFIININSLNIAYLLFLTMGTLSILNAINFSNTNSIELIIVLFLIFMALFILIVKLKTKETILKNSNAKLVEYNENYTRFLDEYKIYKHNIKHKLIAMKTFGNKKINSLIDDLLDEENHFDIKNSNLYNVPNGIKGIVVERLYNIKYDVIINNNLKEDPFIKLSPRSFHSISECLGIALDNALEASQETEKPVIILNLSEDKDNVIIQVGNNFKNSIDINKLGTKYYSTKNRGSGLGLFSIMRNNLVKERINIVNDFYYIELQIKKAR